MIQLHPLEKIAKRHFGVTYDLRETGYILSDGTFLDFSGRHYAGGYQRRGDRFVPKRGQPDYLRAQRSVDHRELPEEITDVLGRSHTEGMLAFMYETGVLRVNPGVGVAVVSPPTVEALTAFVEGWQRVSRDEPALVDINSPDGRTKATGEIEELDLEKIVEFLESRFRS